MPDVLSKDGYPPNIVLLRKRPLVFIFVLHNIGRPRSCQYNNIVPATAHLLLYLEVTTCSSKLG